MPKIADQPLRKVLVRLFADDYDRLKDLYGPNTGVNQVIRLIVHKFVQQTTDEIRQRIDEIESELRP